jgi:hypothetical protein
MAVFASVVILIPVWNVAFAKKNLTGYDYLFTDEVRKQGLEHLEVIKTMILKSGDDRRAVMGDMTY